MRDYAADLPVFLELDLYQAGWNGSINPYPGMSVKQFAMMSLRRSLTKKFVPSDTKLPDLAALELFLKCNSECGSFVPTGDLQLTSAEALALSEAKDFIFRFCHEYDESVGIHSPILNVHSISDNLGFGPGASIGSKTEDFLSKVGSSTMAATSTTLHALYMQAISNDRVWADVESVRLVNRGAEIVQGSRLAFVPKTAEISRTICTEPLCNMMFQKGIGEVLTQQLRRSCGIDLRSQPDKNRTLARLGSETGEFGTIDLSSASDSISLGLVREFFPRDVVSWLELTRSPVTTLPGGEQVELQMVSSMGNAFTFPLQTLLFCALVYGSYRVLGIHFERPRGPALGNFAVFGDDIIVRKEAYDLLLQLLSICGFKANVNKSFNSGLFRESCGHDYYCGHNVRGVYIQYIRDDCDKYSAINRLNRWSVRHGITLYHTVSFLRKGVRVLWIPLYEDDASGIMVPRRSIDRPRYDKNTGGLLYRYVSLVSKSVDVASGGDRPIRLEGWVGNHSSILLAALAGTLRAGKVVYRLSSRRLTRIKQRVSPCWDSFSAAWGENPKFDDGWKAIIEINLDLL
jgi:hypothetical protein